MEFINDMFISGTVFIAWSIIFFLAPLWATEGVKQKNDYVNKAFATSLLAGILLAIGLTLFARFVTGG